jgi:hypothetical protein
MGPYRSNIEGFFIGAFAMTLLQKRHVVMRILAKNSFAS